MITLDGLSAELLSEILTLVHDSSRHTIFSLLRVNKAVSVASIPFVYRECTFDFSQYEHRAPDQPAQVGTPYTRSLEKLAYLLERYPGSDPAIWKGVRKTTVHSNSVIWEGEPEIIRWDDPPFIPSEGLVEKKWSLFVEFLSRVVNLREVVFDCHEQVPLVLLNILEEKHPDSRLHVKSWTRISCDVRVGDPHEEKLARSPCLRSIEARFKTGGPRMDLNLAALTRILALSPNLEEISYSSRESGGCVEFFFDEETKAEHARERGRFRVVNPSMKSSLERIRWNELDVNTIQGWGIFINLDNIQHLEVDCLQDTEWMEYARENGLFRGLKHLSFRITHDPEYSSGSADELKSILNDFISSCTHLESLSIVNYHGYIDLPSILHRHGKSLQSLALHQMESTEGSRPILTQEDLNLVLSEAPHLERLVLDVNRTINPNDNESKIYKALSSFRGLRALALYYDLGIHYKCFRSYLSDEDRLYRAIYFTADEVYVREVWEAIEDGGVEEIFLYVGEPRREIGAGRPAGWVLQERRERQQFYLSRNERDDLRNDVSAVKIERSGPSQFQRVSSGT